MKNNGPAFIRADEIIVRDIGRCLRQSAWWWLVMGHEVYDHQFNPVTMAELEYEVDPNGIYTLGHRRMLLWQRVPLHLWKTKDPGGDKLRFAQPGMNVFDIEQKYSDCPSCGGSRSSGSVSSGESTNSDKISPSSESTEVKTCGDGG